ncbi:MAG: histidine kinase [Chitinophagales bacterium]|nr:histidine kinase [Chitinophagales bacterium]
MPRQKLPFPYIYAIIISFVFALLWGLTFYLSTLYTKKDYPYVELILYFANYATWGLLYPLAYRLIIWAGQFKEVKIPVLIFRILLSGLILAILHETISNILFFSSLEIFGYENVSAKRAFMHAIGILPAAMMTRLIEFGILFAVFTGLEYQRKFRDKQIELAQTESQLSGAQLNALRLQLQPHFLFNTLNTISSLVDIDKKRAQKILSQLGSLLRFVLDQNRRHMVALREELDFIKNYLNIEQVRFLDRLTISYNLAPETLDALVPSLLLQPLVENAIKHGFANQTGEGHIEVKSERQNGEILLTVKDDGNGSSKDSNQLLSSGIGLLNVKKRLELIYKDKAKLKIDTQLGHGFNVQICIPYQS